MSFDTLPDGLTAGTPTTTTVTIEDDDEPNWLVSVVPASIAEANESAATVSVSSGGVTFTADRTISLNFVGTATEAVDYEVAAKTLTLAVGEHTVATTVSALDDSVSDLDEQILVRATLDGARIGAQQTITIADDDEASDGIVLEVAPNRVNEDAGATTLTVTGTLNGSALTTDTLVSLTLAAGTATVTTDYTVSSNTATLTIPAAATSGTASFRLTPVDDAIDDDDETVTIAASTTSALTLSTSSLTVTIADNDEPNAAPVFTPPALTRSLAENSAAGVAVGAAVTATDADNDTLLYSLGVAGAASFTIHSATGQIGTAPGVVYDHEGARNRYVLTVTADDSRGGLASATVTINISDTDEPPPAPAAPAVSPTRGATDSLDVEWTAPSTTGRPGISGYELLYRSRGGAWAAWPHPGTGIVATISGVIADTSYEVQVRASNDEGASGWSESGEGSTYSEEDLCSAEGPTPAVVAVTSLPIVVASTANVYFVLYVTHELDGVEVWTPVSVTRGTAVSTTLTENVDGLPASRYRVERYLVADPADVDGDCVDDLTELDAPGQMNPLNPAPAITVTDGAVAIPGRDMFEALSFTEPTAQYEYVKFTLLDMDSERPLLYFINSTTHVRHPIAFFLETIGHAGPDLPWAIPGEIVYDPDLLAADGTRGVYYFWFVRYDGRYTPGLIERAYALLTAAMPLLGDNLPMYIPNHRLASYQADLASLRASRIPLLFNEDVFPDTEFLALNTGTGFGRLRVMAPGERPSPRDIVIYEALPNELPRVAGIITSVPQTPLSHVNLRAVQDDVPNAFIDDALGKDEIDDLVDSYVRYEVTADGYALRAATLAEVEAHFAASRPRHVQTPERDLTVTTITALSDVRLDDWRAFGVKAANVAVLGTLGFPAGTVPDGFAVPFYFYDEFMKHTALGEETVFGKGKGAAEDQFTLGADATLIDAVQAILAHPKFQTDFEIQDEMLDDLRDAIEDAQSPQWIIDALTAMHATYPQGQSLRYRSSTNNEDLPGFSGAGLYDSNTQKPDETLEDGIDKSLKQVFASLWNFRAFTEREFHRIDHLATAMGVLVHPNYSDELANGVAVSFDPIRGYSSYYYLNTQLGEDLVTNPDALSEPEEILLHRSGDFYEVLATSNQVTPGSLLMSDAQMDQLADHLTVIHERFAQLYSNRPFAIEIEFKITVDNILAIKQARPWVFSGASTTIEAPVRVSFTQESFTAVEGATASVVVGLSAPSGPFGVTIPIVVTGGTASADEYSAPEPVVFSSGDDRQTVSIPLGDDALIEGDETIALAFGDLPTGVTPGTNATTTVTITDADSAAFEFAISDDEVGEGATVELTVTLDGVATFATAQTIDLTFPGGGASAGVDFTVADSSGQTLTGPYALTLPAGSSSVAATLSIVDDAAEEGNETIVVRAWHGADALGGLQVITILANDEPIVGNTPPVFRDGQSAARSLAENTGPSINIGRPLAARDVDQGDTLTYSLGGTDAGSFDISLTSGQLRTKSGVAYDHEARSSYRVTVSVSDGEATASITVSIAVTDEDEPPAAPVVQVDTASPVSLEVTWLAPATPDRPAVSNYDLRYKLAGESTFIDGPQDVSGTSASIGELIPASSYDVQVRATNAEGDGAWSASQPGVTAVLPVVALILSASSIPEDRGMSTVTATVSPVSPTPFSVEIWATAFPPIPGQFETSLNNILSFAANETQSTGEVVITGLVATVVNVTGTVSPAGVLVKPPARVQLRITAGDPEVTVRFGSATYNVPEGGIRRVSVVLDEDPERTVVIPITKTNQGGARSGDYSVDPDPTNVTFNAGGDLTQTFTFTATPDTDDDDGESVLLGFDTPNLPTRVSVGTTSQSTVRITDDDDPEVTVKFGATSINVGEGDRATITVTISADPERELRIPIIAAGGNGADPTDFRLNPVLVTFPSGSDADRTFTVTAFDDTQDDDGETVELSFGEMPDDRVSPDPDPDSHTSVTVTLVDNDDPVVTVSFRSDKYTVPESDDPATTSDRENQITIKVVLSADPERTVTIPIRKANQDMTGDGDYSGVPSSVTFNAGDTEKAFTFTATPDTVDDDGDSVLLGFGTMPDARVTAGTTSQSTVRITDDDDPEVTVKFGATSINVGEGDRATITVTISADPERELRIPIIAAGGNGADPTDFRLNPVLVTFPSGSDADRTFTVTAFDDTQDDDGETVELSFGEMPDDRVRPDPDPDSHTSVTVTLVDNDDPVVTASFQSDKYTVPESDDPATTSDRENQITIKVVLSADPERTVTIPIRKANQDMTGDGDYSGVPSSVTFNAGDTEKAFTFTATPDTVDDDGDSVLLSFGTPLPARVSTLAPIQSTVSITDDDDPEVTVKFGASTLNLGEGNSATITVTISADPERTVVVPFVVTYGVVVGAGANDHSAVPANVIFTAGGDQSQTFSFTATQDDIDDDNERVILGFDTANLPSRVTAVNPSTQTINIGDDDKRGVAVTPLTLSVNEGMDGEYTVVLTSEPTAPVTVTPSTTSTEVTLSGALTFRPGNWGTPQTVTVRAPEDGDAVSEMLTITHTVSGGDYGAVTVSNVAVSLGDNDVAGVAITPSNLTIRENATDTFNVKLNTEPGNDVTVTISSRDAAVATVSLDSLTFTKATSLTFTTIDWNSEQTVTVRGVEDDGAADNNTTITFGVSGYGSVTTAADVTISVTDDDTRAVTISTSALTVEEEAATADPPTNTYTVVLATQPEGNVTLAITSDNADIRVNGRSATATSPYNLTFTGGNWDAPQTVTVTVVNDLDGWNEEATLTHAVRGADYAMVNADSVMVTVTDNDPLGLRVSPAEYTTERVDVTEGTTYSYTLALLTVPLGDVTVDITSDNPDVTVDPTKLTILAAQWNAPHTVKITVAADPDGEDEPATLSHTLSGYGTYTTGPDFLVQVLDGNEPGVFIEPTTLAIPEGFNDAYSVSLRTEPSGTVTVQVAGHAGTDVTVMPDSLTFSSSDWNVPQAVTVTAAEDEDADNDTVTLTHAVSGYGTVTTTDAVTVTIVDRDEEGITVTDVTPPLEDPNEGDTPATGTYTVVLDTQPTGEVMVAITSNNPDVTVMPESLTFTTSDWNQPQTVTVTAVGDADATDDTATLTHQASGSDYSATAAVMVTVTDLDDPPTTSTSTGGGGGGGPSGPSPSKVEFEWNVTRDIETLDSGHDAPTGAWSDGTLLWIAENGDGADDAVYAYDLVTGKRVEDREFELHETNRAPRGLWSNSKTAWVADSGQNRLFAYDLASGERDEEREVALDTRNRDPRGIWSDDGTTVWVLDGGKNALFAYDLATGELIAEHTLDSTNGDPRGLWSDGVTIWVSDHGAKRLFAYRIPQDGETASEDEDDAAEEADLGLERVIDEEFKDLPKASNNSPRGIWSDGDVMYVADESDAKVYSYNLPAAIDARLASLTLSGVEFGEFLSRSTEYEGVADEGVTETTVEAEAARRGATVAIAPADADEATDGHQLALDGVEAITVTVTSADGSRTKVYLVRFAEAAEAEQPVVACLRGAVTVGFSLLIYGGGSVAELLTCAESRSVTALYVPHDGKYVSYILGAPDFVNSAFREVYPDGVPALTPLTVKSEGPPSPAPPSDDVPEFGPECLRGAIATGFSLVLYEGGSVEALDTCAQRLGVTALYALVDGEWVSYILGAPAFVNREFRELFTDGLPALTPLVGKRDAP